MCTSQAKVTNLFCLGMIAQYLHVLYGIERTSLACRFLEVPVRNRRARLRIDLAHHVHSHAKCYSQPLSNFLLTTGMIISTIGNPLTFLLQLRPKVINFLRLAECQVESVFTQNACETLTLLPGKGQRTRSTIQAVKQNVALVRYI